MERERVEGIDALVDLFRPISEQELKLAMFQEICRVNNEPNQIDNRYVCGLIESFCRVLETLKR